MYFPSGLPLAGTFEVLLTIAHIINPFHASGQPDLAVAQPITFESMRAARRQAEGLANVELLSAQFAEDRDAVPEGFRATSDLERSTLDAEGFDFHRKLPLIAEILQRAHDESDADYIVYTNVDIGLQREFYLKALRFIAAGHDGFIINRRRIPAHYTRPDQLPEIYMEKGKRHPGFDCFVFRRELIPTFSLAGIAVGVPFIGIGLAQNLFCFARNPRVFEKEFLTFHLGTEVFRKRTPREYFRYNRQEFRKAVAPIFRHMDSRKWPYGDRSLPERMIRWGLNPSLPIKLALRLELRRWGPG